ncbi:hypothetical protein [Thermogutta sp.]|uniref:hypothetical protein n=1 Tax=Thermogutta sp. TaxID=1962930 RepID=UPI0032201B00
MTTSLQRNEPTWPFLLVLIALFILSVTSPRAWRVVERPDPPIPGDNQSTFAEADRPPRVERRQNLATTSPALPPPLASTESLPAAQRSSRNEGALQPAEVQHQVAADMAHGPSLLQFPPDPEREAPCLESIPDERPMAGLAEETHVTGAPNSEDLALHADPSPSEHGHGNTMEAQDGSSDVPPQHGLWTPPTSLLAMLEPFAQREETRGWVSEVREKINELGQDFEAGKNVLPVLQEIYALAQQSSSIQTQLDPQPDLAADFRQVRYALIRRLSLWKAIQLAGGLQAELATTQNGDWARLEKTLNAVEHRLGTGSTAQAWREFLNIEPVKTLVQSESPSEAERQLTELAARTLERIDDHTFTEDQQALLDEQPLAEYVAELRFWAAPAVQAASLLQRVENFESKATNSAAEPLVRAYHRLARSSQDRARWLARCLDLLYRNANVRIAITEELLNRLAPERPADERPVADVILNRPVYGSSYAETKVGFRLIPDPLRARVALTVRGHVTSLTYANAGPATIWNDGCAEYVAEKDVEITPHGLVASPAVIDVQNSVRIRDVATTLDSIPVLGFLTQEVARQQAVRQRLEASEEARWKVAAQALREIENETETQFSRLNQRWREEVLAPLRRFHLAPTWLGAQTTEDRIVLRVRLAAPFQPGGHTLRPFAPADALASCQIHQSAINNFLQRLGLEGKTYTVAELQSKLREKLHLPEDDSREENPHADARITFASRDAARVEFVQGKLIITLAVAELSSPPNRWQDFQVRALYRPEIHNDRIQFIREGVVQLVGPMDMRSQIALRSVFSRTFSKDKPWEVSPGFLQRHENLTDLTVTQLVLEDGWLGFAVGRRPAMAATQRGDDHSRH